MADRETNDLWFGAPEWTDYSDDDEDEDEEEGDDD